MDLAEIEEKLGPFVRAKLGGGGATVSGVEKTAGHAGFSYFFDVTTAAGALSRYFLRLPPPGVKWEGTADVLRQVAALQALDGSGVPHCSPIWWGDDLEWFGCPYFVTERLNGDTMRPRDELWQAAIPQEHWWSMAAQGVRALAGIHRVDSRKAQEYLGEYWGFEFDITRWDRFAERAAEPARLALQPRVKQRLLDTIPAGAHIGLFHGDFQWANVLYSPPPECKLLAVIDWELTGIGPTLNDLGWVCTFNDERAWGGTRSMGLPGAMPGAGEIEQIYAEAWGANPGKVAWFRASAAYKFSIISGFNLMLHRRGKRPDPTWEETSLAMAPLMEYALVMLE